MSNNNKALPVGVNSTVTLRGAHLAGFVAATAGQIVITIRQENAPDVVLPAIPVAAGQWVDLPFFVGTTSRSTLETTGGASGVVAIS